MAMEHVAPVQTHESNECECQPCREADTYINRYLLEDLDNVVWSVDTEASKYQDTPSHLREALIALDLAKSQLIRYRASELNLQ